VQLKKQALDFRESLALLPDHVLFGRFSRPEPNKWTPMILPAFLDAHLKNPNLRLLLREPPAQVASDLRSASLASPTESTAKTYPILILTATSEAHELAVSQMACDVILHTSSIGESFGYGIAEPMSLGKPVITNSVPWHDQAQLELVRQGECGLIGSTVSSLKAAILRMAEDRACREAFGESAKKHILSVADQMKSTDRVKMAMRCAIENRGNPLAKQDLEKARETAEYLDRNQWGHTLQEKLWLESKAATIRFLRWQRQTRNGFKSIRNHFF
jgi:glycosyltransferase involved in cell wall biosynthesis